MKQLRKMSAFGQVLKSLSLVVWNIKTIICLQIVFAIVCLSPNLGIALHTLESPIREALLKPRNYNPHPYEQSYSYHNDYTVGINPNTIENVDNIAKNPFLNIPLEYTSPSQHPSNGVLRFNSFQSILSPINICLFYNMLYFRR